MNWTNPSAYLLVYSSTLNPEIFNSIQSNLGDMLTKEVCDGCYLIFSEKTKTELTAVLFKGIPGGSKIMLFSVSDSPSVPK